MAIFDSGIFDANIFDTAIVFAYPTGVVATGHVGVADATGSSIALVSSPEMSGLVVGVTVAPVTNVFAIGVQATGLVSQALVWSNISPDQNPSYASIAPSQSPAYSPAVPDQDPNWVTVAA